MMFARRRPSSDIEIRCPQVRSAIRFGGRFEGTIAGILGALASLIAGRLLRDDAGGAEPLMAIFPVLTLVAVRWGARAGMVMLTLGVVGAWYVYVGRPLSFEVTSQQAGSLSIASVSGGLILLICNLLSRSIAGLRAADAASTDLAKKLAERTLDLEQALEDQAGAWREIEFSERQFRVSFEHAAVGKLQTEPESGKIIRANQAFCDMLGYAAGDLIGTDERKLTFPDDIADDQDEYQKVLRGEAPRYIREKRYIKRDGSLIWVRVSLAIVRSPVDDRPLLAVAVIENVDDQHRYQRALEQSKADLEQALRQRDLLLREVYHRVKNNLQVVDGLLLLQKRRINDAEAKSQLQQTRDRIFALGLVHHQLMGSADLQTFDVSPFLNQLVDNLRAAGNAPSVAIEVSAGPIKVDLDFAIPLGLIVTELVTNALKHAFLGVPGRITVALEEDGEGTLTLLVADDGKGLPADGGYSQNTGLGMKIVAGLLDQIGGRLHRDGSAGTTYRISFERRRHP